MQTGIIADVFYKEVECDLIILLQNREQASIRWDFPEHAMLVVLLPNYKSGIKGDSI